MPGARINAAQANIDCKGGTIMTRLKTAKNVLRATAICLALAGCCLLAAGSARAGNFADLVSNAFCKGGDSVKVFACKVYVQCRVELGRGRSEALAACNNFCADIYKGPNPASCRAACDDIHSKDN